jgi:hypothetical protein
LEASAQKKTLRAAEQDRPDVKAARQHWRVRVENIDPRRFRFIDESGAKTNMVRSRAVYGEGGAKAKDWQQTMLDAAWRQGSLVMLHRLAPYIRRHAGERREALESLRAYVEKRIAKTDYPSFRKAGYDCGSGPTESQCGTLTARVKGPGMRWDSGNAEAMLALAALDHSRQWPAYRKLQRAA